MGRSASADLLEDVDMLFDDVDLEDDADKTDETPKDEEPKKEEPKKEEKKEEPKPQYLTAEELDGKLSKFQGDVLGRITDIVKNAVTQNKPIEDVAKPVNNAVEKAQTYLKGLVAEGKISQDALDMWEGIFDSMAIKKSRGKYENFDSFFERTGSIEGNVSKLSDGVAGLSDSVIKRELTVAISELKTDPKLNKQGALFPTYNEWYEEVFLPEYTGSEKEQNKVANALKHQDTKAYFKERYLAWVGENANDDSFIKGHAKLMQRMEDRKRGAGVPLGDQTVTVKRGKEEEKKSKGTQDIVFSTLSKMIGSRLYG